MEEGSKNVVNSTFFELSFFREILVYYRMGRVGYKMYGGSEDISHSFMAKQPAAERHQKQDDIPD